jgi:hypothetical protein
MKRETALMQWIIGYGLFLVSLFAACTAILGLTTTIWGFVSIFVGCVIASLALWWQEEYQWKNSPLAQEMNGVASATMTTRSDVSERQTTLQNTQQIWDPFPLKADDFDLLARYTQDLTDQVEAVYPLVDRDHIHKIVWTVMIELFAKSLEPAAHITQASIIAAKIARAV